MPTLPRNTHSKVQSPKPTLGRVPDTGRSDPGETCAMTSDVASAFISLNRFLGPVDDYVTTKPPVTKSQGHTHTRNPEQYIVQSCWLIFCNVRVAWKTVAGRSSQSCGNVCQETQTIAHYYHHSPSSPNIDNKSIG